MKYSQWWESCEKLNVHRYPKELRLDWLVTCSVLMRHGIDTPDEILAFKWGHWEYFAEELPAHDPQLLRVSIWSIFSEAYLKAHIKVVTSHHFDEEDLDNVVFSPMVTHLAKQTITAKELIRYLEDEHERRASI